MRKKGENEWMNENVMNGLIYRFEGDLLEEMCL